MLNLGQASRYTHPSTRRHGLELGLFGARTTDQGVCGRGSVASSGVAGHCDVESLPAAQRASSLDGNCFTQHRLQDASEAPSAFPFHGTPTRRL